MKGPVSFFCLSTLLAFSVVSAKETTPAKSSKKATEATAAKSAEKSPAAKPAEKMQETAQAQSKPQAATPANTAAALERKQEVSAPKAEGKNTDPVVEKAQDAATVKAEEVRVPSEEKQAAATPSESKESIASSEAEKTIAVSASKENTAPVALEVPPVDITKISEAFGHVIGKNLETLGIKFDIAQVIKGLQDAIEGKDSPMSEMECIQAITAAQEAVFKKQCAENLKRAEEFLAGNAKAAGVVALEEGKVQYKITEQGKGVAVESHFSPLIKYSGKYLDGSVFGSSKEEEAISLDEIIPGLKAGLIGMREGEKRTVFIHPDLAYGTHGYLPPNSLLTFDVEIVKANAPIVKETSDAETPAASEKQEIAETKTDIR